VAAQEKKVTPGGGGSPLPPTENRGIDKLTIFSYFLSIFYIISLAMDLPELTFSSINCNSLNMSDIGSFNHCLKVYGIVKLKTDVITLSDIGLCNNRGVSNISELRESFQINPYCAYDFYHNSHSSKRGVGILLRKSCGFSVLQEFRDCADNILFLRISKAGVIFNIGSIYGPNENNPLFFADLRNMLTNVSGLGTEPIIISGDWNCT